ncbi:MAG: DUF4097 family beta strand repeat-containing protein [Stackebrandtia sp.]
MPEFACDGPISVSITLASGSCEVLAEDRADAVVSVTPHKNNKSSAEAAERTKVDFRDNKLTVRAPEGMTGWLTGGSGSIDVVVKVPSHSSVTAKSASAPITYRGEIEVASATTASATIVVEKAAEASVNTASGDVHVIECVGPARGNTVSGDLQLDHVGGDVNAKSVSGDVRIGYAGRSVQGNSVSGDINVSSIRSGHCRIKSVSGAVSMGVAPGTGVWMDINSVSGTTSSDLAVGDMPADTAANLELHINTVSGNIDLYRAQPV